MWKYGSGAAALGLFLAAALPLVPLEAQSPPAKESAPAKPARPAWTTSRVTGAPDPPPPYKVVRAFPNLKFTHP
jgi:hypothetical protein